MKPREIKLSPRDVIALLEALDSPPPPCDRLIEAAKRHGYAKATSPKDAAE